MRSTINLRLKFQRKRHQSNKEKELIVTASHELLYFLYLSVYSINSFLNLALINTNKRLFFLKIKSKFYDRIGYM